MTRPRTMHPQAVQWFEDLMTVDDMAQRLRSFDEACAFAPDRMEGLLASILIDDEMFDDPKVRAAGAVFWMRAVKRHLWPNDRWINRTAMGLIKLLEDSHDDDEEGLLG
jgi:hypothetical protein